jgi:hypothetical protein
MEGALMPTIAVATCPSRPSPPSPAARRDRLLRSAGLAHLAVATFLVPWCVLLAVVTPATAVAHNWSLSWVGLDAAEAACALTAAVLLARRDPRAALPVTATGTLLLVDCWFDVCTSAPGPERLLAVAEGVLAELPLACAAIWLAVALLGRRP